MSNTQTKAYEVIGTPHIESEYSDEYETTMVITLRRIDGETGDVWIVAGVPDYMRGSSDAAHTQRGYERVRVFGDSSSHWCPESFRPADGNYDFSEDIIAAVEALALATHRN